MRVFRFPIVDAFQRPGAPCFAKQSVGFLFFLMNPHGSGEGKWCAQGDDFRTFLGDFVASLPQYDFPDGLRLYRGLEFEGGNCSIIVRY